MISYMYAVQNGAFPNGLGDECPACEAGWLMRLAIDGFVRELAKLARQVSLRCAKLAPGECFAA